MVCYLQVVAFISLKDMHSGHNLCDYTYICSS